MKGGKKKIVPFVVLGILVLPGFGTVVKSDWNQIVNKPLMAQDWRIEIVVEGWWFGYRATIGTVTNESVTGDYIINISTDARSIIVGRDLGYELMNLTLDEPEFPIEPDLSPLIGFGLATINISIHVSITDPIVDEFLFQKQVKGFILFFYVFCPKTTFTLP